MKDTTVGVLNRTLEELFEIVDKTFSSDCQKYDKKLLLNSWLKGWNYTFTMMPSSIRELFSKLDEELLIREVPGSINRYEDGAFLNNVNILSGIYGTVFVGSGDYLLHEVYLNVE